MEMAAGLEVTFFDVVCIVPVYLAVRSLIGHSFRNLWLLWLAQFTLILYLFLGVEFNFNAELISFSFLLIPLSIDAYKGVVLWRSENAWERLDAIGHLITTMMLIYQHPYARADRDHLGFVGASAMLGFLLGQTARRPEAPSLKS